MNSSMNICAALLALKSGNVQNQMGCPTRSWGPRLEALDCGSNISSSDAQIFKRGDLKKKIKDGSLGLQASEPLWERGPDLHYFFLGDNSFAFMPWMVKPYNRRKLTREERIAGSPKARGW